MRNDRCLLFRFVPTMRCNYKCSYCFVPGDVKRTVATMFDEHSPEEWVRAMGNFSDYDVEFYCWGGEPFLLDGTYEVVKGWTAYDHVISGSRLDTNMAFTDKIAKKCPTDKVKLNCSWHTQYDPLDRIQAKVTKLNDVGMVGMLNFVASRSNLQVLERDYGMTVDDLIGRFRDLDVFVNIAADFGIVNGTDPSSCEEYKEFILRYQNPDDWAQLRCEKSPCICEANHHFFTVHPNGDITPCLSGRICGNFFEGTLEFPELEVCHEQCPSLVAYPFRTDNSFPYQRHLVEYVSRNKAYRESVGSKTAASIFDLGSGGYDRLFAQVASKPPRISVVMPTYNQARFLPTAVQSILSQTLDDFEFIIVNDGSTDGTREYLDSLTDPRIRVIHQSNQRLPNALNTGFNAARGELLTWVSSDNYEAPIFLEALAGALDAYPEAGFAYSAFAMVDDSDQIVSFMRDQDAGKHVLLALNPNITAFMYRRACQDTVGLYDPELEGAEDWDMWVRISEQFPSAYVPEVLCYYRTHSASMTEQIPDKIRQACRKTFDKSLKRRGEEIDLPDLYPAITYCWDQASAAFDACFDLGSRLLTVHYDANEEAAQFLEAALSARRHPYVAADLAIAYGRMGQWDSAMSLAREISGTGNPLLRRISSMLDEAHRSARPELLNDHALVIHCPQSGELFAIMRDQRRVFSLTVSQSQDDARRDVQVAA